MRDSYDCERGENDASSVNDSETLSINNALSGFLESRPNQSSNSLKDFMRVKKSKLINLEDESLEMKGQDSFNSALKSPSLENERLSASPSSKLNSSVLLQSSISSGNNDSASSHTNNSQGGSHVGNSQSTQVTSAIGDRPKKKKTNPWGEKSYAELIEKAILESPDKRLHLSEIYEAFKRFSPYFKNQPCANSSTGWKNSIRHNLSLRNRFVRCADPMSKKSYWTLEYLTKNPNQNAAMNNCLPFLAMNGAYHPGLQNQMGYQTPPPYFMSQHQQQTAQNYYAQHHQMNFPQQISPQSIQAEKCNELMSILVNCRPAESGQQAAIFIPPHKNGTCGTCNDIANKYGLNGRW